MLPFMKRKLNFLLYTDSNSVISRVKLHYDTRRVADEKGIGC